jgi:predicted metalloendopeptidase
LRQWWDEQSLNEYEKRVDCLVKQYDKFEMSKIGQNVNGSKTLQENFCDNVGLTLVYRLFEKSLNQTGSQFTVLPGLAKYTPQQMFFISYGSVSGF